MRNWTREYLTHLELHPSYPSKAYLINLYQSHLARVPYELTSKFVYSQTPQYIPDVESFVENLVNRGFGGNCYILNFNFRRLLDALGFESYLVKVNPGHVGVVVSVDREEYFLDVGYGAPLNQLFGLHKGDWYTESFGEEIRFTYASIDKVTYDRRNNGQTVVTKEIDLTPAADANFHSEIAASFADDDANRFMRRISMAHVTPSSYSWVRNNRLVKQTKQGEQTIDFKCKNDWIDCMSTQFGLRHEDLRSSIGFLEERGVDLGFESR